MSRIWKMPIALTDKVEAKIAGNIVTVKWPLWELKFEFRSESVSVVNQDNSLLVTKENDSGKALWGTTRAVLNNMVDWVTIWFKKSLEINWVWYKFELQWNDLVLSIGFSHKVNMKTPDGIKINIDDKAKNIIHISWIDKQLVWEYAAKIKAKKKPEPYKGKWIKYVWEHILRKAWKTGSK